MSIDGCDRTFDELPQMVLPGYMKTLRERMLHPLSMELFSTKKLGPVGICRRPNLSRDPRGCYVLLQERRPVYVGISKQVIQRLRDHVGRGDHLTATLAYRIACKENRHGVTAAEAMKDPEFRGTFEAAKERLKSFSVAFVEIDNPLELYVFEAYCAMELDTGFDASGWNTFVTH